MTEDIFSLLYNFLVYSFFPAYFKMVFKENMYIIWLWIHAMLYIVNSSNGFWYNIKHKQDPLLRGINVTKLGWICFTHSMLHIILTYGGIRTCQHEYLADLNRSYTMTPLSGRSLISLNRRYAMYSITDCSLIRLNRLYAMYSITGWPLTSLNGLYKTHSIIGRS